MIEFDTIEVFEVGDSEDAILYDLAKAAEFAGYEDPDPLARMPDRERITLELQRIGFDLDANDRLIQRLLNSAANAVAGQDLMTNDADSVTVTESTTNRR